MKLLITLSVALISTIGWGQNQISLDGCYKDLQSHYPIAKQTGMIKIQNDLEIEAINAKTLPQIVLNAQATYYSDVIQIPIPTAGIEPLNNDQYKTTLSAQQLIYKGGEIQAAKKLQNTIGSVKSKEVEIQLHQLKLYLNQVYFSIIALNQQLNLLHERENQLKQTLLEVESRVKNGLLLESSQQIINIELLKMKSLNKDLTAKKLKSLEVLSSMVGKNIDENTELTIPLVDQNINELNSRPELEFFQLKKDEITNRSILLNKVNAPTLSGFATAGYGNPGLNMLQNSFEEFYILGVQLQWNVFDWNFIKKKRDALEVNREIINTQQEAFQLKNNAELASIEDEIRSLEQQIENDMLIVELQEKVVSTTKSQLTNGLITSSVFITESTNLFEASTRHLQHRIALELAKANYYTTKGKK